MLHTHSKWVSSPKYQLWFSNSSDIFWGSHIYIKRRWKKNVISRLFELFTEEYQDPKNLDPTLFLNCKPLIFIFIESEEDHTGVRSLTMLDDRINGHWSNWKKQNFFSFRQVVVSWANIAFPLCFNLLYLNNRPWKLECNVKGEKTSVFKPSYISINSVISFIFRFSNLI